MCRYPLIFAELLKHTPVDDCANSHMEVENTLIRLREATAEINRATDNTRMRTVLEKTWILQDRLVFANQVRSHNGGPLLCRMNRSHFQTPRLLLRPGMQQC